MKHKIHQSYLPNRKTQQSFILNDSVVSILILTFNDQDLIEKQIKSITSVFPRKNTNYEIIIIDNNSTDQTVNKLRSLQQKNGHLRIMVLSKTYPKEVALTAGLDSCIGDYVILFDLYLSPVDLISILINQLRSGMDIVITKYNDSFLKRGILSNFFLKAIERISTHNFVYQSNVSFGFSRKGVNALTRSRRKNRSVSYLSHLVGLKKEIVSFKPRKEYLYKISQPAFLNLVIDVADIIISNSFKPIRLLTIGGMVASIVFLLYVFVIVILVLVFKMHWIAPQGWISLATVLGSLFFLLFTLLTIISEYIIRIMDESRNEPLYFISDEYDSTNITPKRKLLNITTK